MFCPTSNTKALIRCEKNGKMPDVKLWGALGFSSPETSEGWVGDSKEARLFKRIKKDIRDSIEANMDWHKVYTQQPNDALENVIADIKRNYPELARDPVALDAMLKYSKQYFQGAHCQFVNAKRTGRNKAIPGPQKQSERAIEKTVSSYLLAPDDPIIIEDSSTRPSPACSESTCISFPSPPPTSASINEPESTVQATPPRLPQTDNEFLEFMRSCNPALEELFARGLDLKTLALAFHIATIFEGQADRGGNSA